MDREKVIKGLEAHGCGKSMWRICNKCPYDKEECIKNRCKDNLLADAYALLKEQEAIPLQYSETREEYWHYESICPKCGNRWISMGEDHFCPCCGQAVKEGDPDG